MSINPVDGSSSSTPDTQVQFDAAVDKSKSAVSDEALNEAMMEQAALVGGQFIIMPRAQEILGEAMSAGDEE